MIQTSFAIVRNGDSVPHALRGGVVAIGNFDGVHRGHQAVLRKASEMAHARGVATLAVTFEPHPRTYFRPGTPLFRLTPADVKAELFEAFGINGVAEVAFDEALAGTLAEDFVNRILIERFAATAVVVGYDFHFGKARGGSPQMLEDLGRARGFDVAVVGPAGEGDTVWSASAARLALQEGRVDDAARTLGYRWFVRGEVVHGEKRGRELGFPTANISLAPSVGLMHGVYAVRMRIGDEVHDGVANYGRRPQFDNGAPLLETFLLDISPDLYGKVVEVEFVAFIRPELRFDSVDDLIARMHVDVGETRDLLAAADKAGLGDMSLIPPGAAG